MKNETKKEVISWMIFIGLIAVIISPVWSAIHYRNENIELRTEIHKLSERNKKLNLVIDLVNYKEAAYDILLKSINKIDSTIVYKAGGISGESLLEDNIYEDKE